MFRTSWYLLTGRSQVCCCIDISIYNYFFFSASLCSCLQWRQVLQLPQSHKKGVTCISGIMVSQTEAIFASTASDGTVYVWELILPSSSGGK